MTLGAIHPQDLVLVDKRGVRFHAEVLECSHGELRVRPLDRRVTYRAAGAREVLAHWRKSKASVV